MTAKTKDKEKEATMTAETKPKSASVPLRKDLGSLTLSFLEAAPDHKTPELAAITKGRPRRVVVLAVGEKARVLFQTLDEAAAWRALESALQEEA